MPKFTTSNKSILVFILLLFSTLTGHGQERVNRIFNTQEVQKATIKEFPEYSNNLTMLENFISNYGSKGDDGQVLKVPVIFHLLTTADQKKPDESQVQFQLEVLNKYFGKYVPDTKDFPNTDVEKFFAQGASVGIEFYIPGKIGEISGVEVPAINNITVERKDWGLVNEIQDPKKGGIAAIAPEKVINIWVGKLDSGNAGYAHLPGAPSDLDGIVVNLNFFGNEKGTSLAPYNEGKTLVHLMGTYLGLYELWNESEPCKDDLVEDTPLQDGPISFLVPTDKNSRFVCFCPGTPTAMYMNFMNSSHDNQLSLFTEGQKQRMRAVLISDQLRSGLLRK